MSKGWLPILRYPKALCNVLKDYITYWQNTVRVHETKVRLRWKYIAKICFLPFALEQEERDQLFGLIKNLRTKHYEYLLRSVNLRLHWGTGPLLGAASPQSAGRILYFHPASEAECLLHARLCIRCRLCSGECDTSPLLPGILNFCSGTASCKLLAATIPLAVSVGLPVLDVLCKWIHPIHKLLCLASFI